MKYTLSLIALLVCTLAHAQSSPDDFNDFARVKDGLMVKDYEARDTNSFKKDFAEFMERYSRLGEKEKKENKGYLTSAYYNLACTYSLLGNKKEALNNLMKSGFDDYDHVLEDGDLDPLRNEPGFKVFLAKVKNTKSEYLVTLQADARYDPAYHKAPVPALQYETNSDSELLALKKEYNLDSIAGKGADVYRIISLMHWVHSTIRHNGSQGNSGAMNAANLLAQCTRNSKTCNCRGLAVTLNEVYLAEGFQSRFITCLPKNTHDQDCHVITEVYCKSLGKWIWMDPTFDAYVMDEKGNLLNILEVRDRLVHNKTLILNPDANWNHETAEPKSAYLYNYMAKNLYKLEYPVNSRVNTDTWAKTRKREYIQLNPVKNMPAKTMESSNDGLYTVYYTCNPSFAAAQPQ